MPARDYKLCVSPLSGTVFISKVMKKSPNIMTSDRVVVSEQEFINSVIEWFKVKNDDTGILNITEGDKVILTLNQPTP